MEELKTYEQLRKTITKIVSLFVVILIASIILLLTALDVITFQEKIVLVDDAFYMSYDVASLNNSDKGDMVKLGYDIFMNTAKFIGPDNLNYTGNRLSCTNCHLLGGTKSYAAPLIGIINRFPQYRGREDKIGTIEERINGCLERSLNGNVMPDNTKEMKALVQYLEFLNRYAPNDGKIKGQGFVEITIPEREIDLDHGKQVFTNHCIECHKENGLGIKNSDGKSYQYPPLWGNDSYNNGAGMNRVLTAAKFIKANMPFGATYDSPILTDEEAYDVAGYINQQLRPTKRNLNEDFPNLLKKPISTPYPPYLDPFSIEQHQKGPYQPIIEYYKKKFNILKTK